jgi:hypothetical protein
MWRYGLARLLKNSNGDLASHTGEVFEELIEGIPAFEVVEQILDWDTSASKDGHTALNLRVD